MDQPVTNFLKQFLTTIEKYQLSEDEQKAVSRDKVAFIVSKLTRKKFRRKKLAPQTLEAITNKVKISIEGNRPIHFVVPFGGYKHFWNSSHPEPDWAELFNFRYLTDFVAPALAVYEPGVIIEYMSEDMILTRMNNYPKAALEKYSEIFKQLIEWYNKLTPKNLEFKFFRVGDRVDKKLMIQDVEAMLPERRKAFNELSQEEKDRELHRSNRSLFWHGEQDWTQLSETEKQEKTIESRIIELAYYETEEKEQYMGDYLSGDNHICLVFSFGKSHDNDLYQDLTIGSTYGSGVDHWIGRGILRKRADRYLPDIISRNQYQELEGKLQKVEVHDILPFQNYQSVEVIEE